MIKETYENIIISDIHLGSDISKVKQLIPKLEIRLETKNVKRIILLGDIFQDVNFKRLKKQHWNFLSLLRKYSDTVEIVWVYGNHDYQIVDVMSHLVGIKVYEKYVWNFDNSVCCAIHGHQFDKNINKFLIIKNFFIELYLSIQKIKTLHKIINTCVTIADTSLRDAVKNGAIKLAKEEGYGNIFCGHTHIVEHVYEENINYFNSGCWVSDVGTMIIQTTEPNTNSVIIHKFPTK